MINKTIKRMNNNKPKVLLFGTGEGGRNGFKYLRKSHQVIGFCDNNKAKQGTRFCGHPVYRPEDIPEREYDRIVICSMYKDEIREQLINDFNIPYEDIDSLDADVRVYGSGKPWGCLLMTILLLSVAYSLTAFLLRFF